MSNFENYAIYYNLLYRDKDYDRESVFVLNLLEKYGDKPKTLLDLGCGTGRHALALAHKGIRITGVDISEQMLEMGRLEEGAANNLNIPPELIYGDARTVRLGKTLSACVSLFHVLSYQVTEKDCCAMLRTALEHLEPGGLFMFDFWYGPGVLHLRPENRELVRETP